MTVIELGLVSQGDGQPGVEPGRRPLGRGDLRRLLVTLVAVFCVFTATGSARPEPHEPRELWGVPFEQSTDTYLLTDDTVFVLARPGDATLTAYDLRTGTVRWSRTGFEDATWLTDIVGGVLLLPAAYRTVQVKDADGVQVSREFSEETIGLDVATGRQLWRQRGELATGTADRVLLTERDAAGEQVETLRVVRLRDGGTIWSRPVGGRVSWVTDTRPGARPERLVTIGDRGRAEVLDFADGSLISTGTVPWDGRSAQQDYFAGTSLEGRQLFLQHSTGERPTIVAYDTETMRELWHIQPEQLGGTYGCGPALCVNAPTETSAYDRRTGELRWRVSGTSNGFPLKDGLLLIDEAETGSRQRLIDAATGRQLADLGTAVPVWDHELARVPYLVGLPSEPAGFMLVSWFNEKTGEVLLRGKLPAVVDYGCRSGDTLLACVTLSDRLVVTDVG